MRNPGKRGEAGFPCLGSHQSREVARLIFTGFNIITKGQERLVIEKQDPRRRLWIPQPSGGTTKAKELMHKGPGGTPRSYHNFRKDYWFNPLFLFIKHWITRVKTRVKHCYSEYSLKHAYVCVGRNQDKSVELLPIRLLARITDCLWWKETTGRPPSTP